MKSATVKDRVRKPKQPRRKPPQVEIEERRKGLSQPDLSSQASFTQPNSMIQLQQVFGNRAMLQRLQDGSMDSLQAWPLHRQTEGGETITSEGPVSFDTSDLEREGELPGHANLGGNIAQQSLQPAQVQRNGGLGYVTANINLTSNTPTVINNPAADIASAHGRPGVAGWTTPKYDVQVPSGNSTSVNINVTMDYDMELASEFTGEVLNVLRDHENGHVNIGNTKAREHLVDGMKNNLEMRRSLDATSVRQAIGNAVTQFVTDEATGSQVYDANDYPRMEQAYLGARTPLPELMSQSSTISALVVSLNNFNMLSPSGGQDTIHTLAQNVLDAHDALSEDEISRLQYNTQFRQLINACRGAVQRVIERYEVDLWIVEFSMMFERVRNKLSELQAALDSYQWLSPV